MDVDWMGSQTCEPVPAKSCSWVTCVTAWGLDRDCLFLSEDGKRLSHNPLNVLLLCVGKTEYHVIRSRSAYCMALIGPVTVIDPDRSEP